MVVGEFKCAGDGADGGPTSSDPIALPWETSFENGFCDYTAVAGFCYRFPPINFRLVDQPVHSGKYAVEITVVTRTDGGDQPQGRCAREGVLPVEAYYGAWYLIPKTATVLPSPDGKERGLWNLFHIVRGTSWQWDVSLDNPLPAADGGTIADGGHGGKSTDLLLLLYGRVPGSPLTAWGPAIPIGRWFHIVLYLKRAKDKTGAAALYLDGEKVAEMTNIVTDPSPADKAQWYVGNLAAAVDPPECTVYMDDVTIRSTL
jgi:hypothetical protein